VRLLKKIELKNCSGQHGKTARNTTMSSHHGEQDSLEAVVCFCFDHLILALFKDYRGQHVVNFADVIFWEKGTLNTVNIVYS